MPKQKLPKTAEKPGLRQRLREKVVNWVPDRRTIVAVLIGGLITLLCSYIFYVKEAQDLVKKYNMLVVASTTPGMKLEINKNGEFVPIYEGSAKMILPPVKASLKAEINPPAENEGKPGKPENPGQGK